jgi:D-alanyl-D-alanine carboxypeptidase/D-alanyl-D-alanine-endopeptidase (penicillin-binding protein 4)
MNIKIISTLLCVVLTVAGAAAQTSEGIQEKIEQIVNGDVLREAVVGVCARTGDGRTIVDINAGDMLVPASNMKLISTGTALHTLGSRYRYKTAVAYDGNIIDGVLIGDIYIIGGGDPTVGSKDSIASPVEHTFALWERMLRDAGISEVDGRIIGTSGDFFSGMAEEPSWMWSDIGTYYGAGVTGLMFYENIQSFNVSAGAEPGAPVNISPSYPATPWMEFRYDCCTGKAGTGDQLYMYTSDLAPVAEVRGTFAVDRKPKRIDCSNKFPELTCAHYFSEWLDSHGITCSHEASDTRLRRAMQPDSLTVIGHTSSPALKRIVFETNHASNNLYAETLLKTLGKELRNEGCYDSSYVAVKNVLKGLGVDMSRGIKIQDGSGLSRQNLVSPDFFCRYLEAMMGQECFEDFVESLPSPGGTGTLASNMKDYPAGTKARIKAKSGSMSGVRCYSGYIIPSEGCKDDTIVFSIMVNNNDEPTWKVRPMLDKIMGMLAELN